uniref:Mediator of RNA polymerase II transcription subunit 15 n=1 Tax=Phallusia mammillata TaxID=59560 RepID=A0A6F9DJV0_9ASCI|nr:mediator of RNA polymerase II transcription subunit 15 [Phallusia mammillata]
MAGARNWKSENVRAQARIKINDAAEQYGVINAIGKGEQLENTIFQKSKSTENYYGMIQQLLQKIQIQGAKNNAANNMAASQDQHNQSQFPQQMQPPQPQPQPPQFQNQPTMQAQQGQQQSQVFVQGGNMVNNQQITGMFAPMQPTQTSSTLPQGSPGQAMQMRPNMTPNSSPMTRVHPGSTTPSPQTGMVNTYRPTWPHPSPGSQFPIKQFPKRPQQPNTQQQPVLTMPDSTGTPQPSGIPSLSPAHQSPQVPTTSPSLRTPGSVQTVHSPGMLAVPSPTSSNQPQSQQQEDEKEYMEKLKHLQKYIEPLSRMINKFNEDQGNYSQEMSKMKVLRDNLMNPRMRLQLCTLDKCEKVLQNWLGAKTPKQPPRNPDQHMCQPFLNVIATATKSPLLNHTLKRTFGPAMRTICGDYTVPDYVPNKKQCLQKAVEKMKAEREKQRVPDLVQGEIARLESKYKVKLDKTHTTDDGSIRILCELDDPKLPAVPPLRLEVPASYPDDCAEWISEPVYSNRPPENNHEDVSTDMRSDAVDVHQQSESLQSQLEPIVNARLKRLGDSSSTISSMITAWETSVREACAVIN